MKLASDAYDNNDEYNTMLRVIGVSITMEYTAKMFYENTIGKIFSWFGNGNPSDEEKLIIKTLCAFSDFIYDTAWYEFKFMPWVRAIWSAPTMLKSIG